MSNKRSLPAALILALCCTAVDVLAQTGAKGGEWRTYGGDLGSTRYAPLDQINAENFSKLQVAWRFKTDVFGVRPDFNLQTTPLMINGVLYATAGSRRDAVAIDAATGELLWVYRLDEGKRAAAAPRQLSGRGVAYWTDGSGDERIFMVTIGYQLVALDAKTGIPVREFGQNGILDLKQNNDQMLDPITGEIGLNTGPIVAKDVVIVGAAHRGGNCAAEQDERERLYPRLRRQDRKAAVDLPHHSAAGRVRQRYVGERLVVVLGQYRRVGAVLRRRRARNSSTCRSSCRPATITAAIARATTSSRSRWSRST